MGKKYLENLKVIDSKKEYLPSEAFEAVLLGQKANFDETVEIHIRLGVDSRQADQQVRGSVVLPNGTGKKVKVLVIAKEEKHSEAKQAGADYVGAEEIVDRIQNENFLDFDIVVASPDMMRVVGRLGKVLGPKGLMPSPKAGTVTVDVAEAVKQIKAGRVEYRLDKTNIIHSSLGKVSFGSEKLLDNFDSFMKAVTEAKPASFKGQYIKSCFTARTMGPGIKIDVTKYVS